MEYRHTLPRGCLLHDCWRAHRRKLVKINGGLEARGSEAVEGVSGRGHHGECGARAYNGGLGAEPPAGSRGRAPGQGVRGAKPPPLKVKAFWSLDVQRSRQI